MSAAVMQDVQSAPLALIGSARAGRRTLLDMLLSAKGYEIAACEDGPGVLEFLKENQPAIAIFDHDLPGMDGREICSRMRFITRLAHTPIAIVTPPVDEMGGAADFESFTDTTTADIVEAEPLGKKRLIERLENVIRDQKGVANDGKMTIAIPTMVPPMPEVDVRTPGGQRSEMDVFVDDDVDIEVDVARAIYSNDDRFDEGPDEPAHASDIPEPTVDPQPVARAWEAVDAESDSNSSTTGSDAGESIEPTEEVEAETKMDDNNVNYAEPDAPVDEYAEDMFLSEDSESPAERNSRADDIDLFSEDSDPADTASAEVEEQWQAQWPEAINDETPASAEAPAAEVRSDAPWNESQLVGVATDRGHDAEATAEASEPAGNKTLIELVTDTEEPRYDDPSSRQEPAAADLDVASPESNEPVTAWDAEQPMAMDSYQPLPSVAEQPVAQTENESTSDEFGDEDLTATIEAAIEAVNLASMEEARFRAALAEDRQVEARQVESRQVESRQVESRQVEVNPVEAETEVQTAKDQEPSAINEEATVGAAEVEFVVKATTVEMVVESADKEPEPLFETESRAAEEVEAEPEQVGEVKVAAEDLPESLFAENVEPSEPEIDLSTGIADKAADMERSEASDGSENDYAEAGTDTRVESPSRSTDGQEEGGAQVLTEERANMQALIAEQTERIENLQERNVLLRQELEQRKADDIARNDERGNLQALIKEQTEAITNLQQRNVQLRQELEQFKAEESKRESERNFLQAHTSEQAETIAKLQQLNALLRQELEQRKADEAPLRDFLQRLLDRDEQSSAYQEAMRAEIISLTRENS